MAWPTLANIRGLSRCTRCSAKRGIIADGSRTRFESDSAPDGGGSWSDPFPSAMVRGRVRDASRCKSLPSLIASACHSNLL